MLVLCSNGLSGSSLHACLKARLSDCRTAALVVTADHQYKKDNYHVPRCRQELEVLGLRVDLFDLDEEQAERLLGYDVVEFIGGNPFYLMDAIRRSGAADVLAQIAERGALIGWSAAAFAFGPTLELVHMYSPEMNFLGMRDLSGLGLTDVQVLPHYGKFLTRFERFEERCRAYEARMGVQVLRLDDGEGIVIDGEDRVICRNAEAKPGL